MISVIVIKVVDRATVAIETSPASCDVDVLAELEPAVSYSQMLFVWRQQKQHFPRSCSLLGLGGLPLRGLLLRGHTVAVALAVFPSLLGRKALGASIY